MILLRFFEATKSIFNPLWLIFFPFLWTFTLKLNYKPFFPRHLDANFFAWGSGVDGSAGGGGLVQVSEVGGSSSGGGGVGIEVGGGGVGEGCWYWSGGGGGCPGGGVSVGQVGLRVGSGAGGGLVQVGGGGPGVGCQSQVVRWEEEW